MHQVILTTHIVIVSLFIVSLLTKTILLFVNQAKFDLVRAKTKVVEMILGTLIILTGGYLAGNIGFSHDWLHIKLTLVVAGMGLGIVGLKKGNKVMCAVACIVFLYIYAIAETRSATLKLSAVEITPPTIELAECNITLSNTNTADCSLFHGESLFHNTSKEVFMKKNSLTLNKSNINKTEQTHLNCLLN